MAEAVVVLVVPVVVLAVAMVIGRPWLQEGPSKSS